jgi:D-amino-acid dehydrogenase
MSDQDQQRSPPTSRSTVIVIGAGIIGVSCALELQRRGYQVTVIDEKEAGSGCSFGNAGNISPGAVVPYSVPGNLRHIPKWMLDPESPLSIRPAYFPKFLPWGIKWLAASKRENAWRISAAMRALHANCLEAYVSVLAEVGHSSLVRTSGQLYVSRVPHKALGSEIEQEMRAAAGVRVEAVAGSDLWDLEPSLSRSFVSGLWLPDNGSCVNPERLVQVLLSVATGRGARFLRHRVEGFVRDGERITGVVLHGGPSVSADHVVLCAGAWSSKMLAPLGVHVPLEAERGYHATLTESKVSLRIPVTNKDASFAVSPMEIGLRAAGTAEYAGLLAPPNMSRARMLLKQVSAMFPGTDVSTFTEWMGMRPSLPDGLPVIDRVHRSPGLILAFGSSHFGLSAAPNMARACADLIVQEASDIDLSPFSVARFRAKSPVAQEMR